MSEPRETTDEEIAAQVQKGIIEQFGILVRRYENKLIRYASKFLFDAEDAKDLVQEICIKAYANIQSFDTSRKFSSWIYRIAHNELVNAYKKKKREKVSFFDLDLFFPHLVAKETADSELRRSEMREMLDRSLEKLDSKYREPLTLYYFEDMEYKEIAEILQIPVSTLGVRLRRGKEALKKMTVKT